MRQMETRLVSDWSELWQTMSVAQVEMLETKGCQVGKGCQGFTYIYTHIMYLYMFICMYIFYLYIILYIHISILLFKYCIHFWMELLSPLQIVGDG